jgi:hypothetical protein
MYGVNVSGFDAWQGVGETLETGAEQIVTSW